MDYLLELQKAAYVLGVKELCDPVLMDERFPLWSGSPHKDIHHYGDGGLVKHTYEVATLVLKTGNFYKHEMGQPINVKELFVSAVWHDYGKIWDYEKTPEGVWQSAEHKYKVYHIVRSALEWEKMKETAIKYNVSHENVLHNILSHHGQFQWKSPTQPQTQEAWILHLSDNMSARVNDGLSRK